LIEIIPTGYLDRYADNNFIIINYYNIYNISNFKYA
jgi:hypothetical protein